MIYVQQDMSDNKWYINNKGVNLNSDIEVPKEIAVEIFELQEQAARDRKAVGELVGALNDLFIEKEKISRNASKIEELIKKYSPAS